MQLQQSLRVGRQARTAVSGDPVAGHLSLARVAIEMPCHSATQLLPKTRPNGHFQVREPEMRSIAHYLLTMHDMEAKLGHRWDGRTGPGPAMKSPGNLLKTWLDALGVRCPPEMFLEGQEGECAGPGKAATGPEDSA